MSNTDREAVLKEATKQYAEMVKSWDDLFTMFDSMMITVRETGHPVAVFDTLFMMYSFMVSMRQLPDEGDITVLMQQMLRNLIINPKESLGFEVEFVTKADAEQMAEEAKARILTQVVSKLLQPVHDAIAEQTVEVTSAGKPVLH